MSSVQIGRVYRHKKRGTTYEAEGLMRLQISPETVARITGLGEINSKRVAEALEKISFVSYSARADDSLWCRPESEFMDGRFELSGMIP
jgi:hypothetical protein